MSCRGRNNLCDDAATPRDLSCGRDNPRAVFPGQPPNSGFFVEIASGETGPTGPQGIQGNIGPTGLRGPTGVLPAAGSTMFTSSIVQAVPPSSATPIFTPIALEVGPTGPVGPSWTYSAVGVTNTFTNATSGWYRGTYRVEYYVTGGGALGASHSVILRMTQGGVTIPGSVTTAYIPSIGHTYVIEATVLFNYTAASAIQVQIGNNAVSPVVGTVGSPPAIYTPFVIVNSTASLVLEAAT